MLTFFHLFGVFKLYDTLNNTVLTDYSTLTSDEAINMSDASFIELPSDRNLVDMIKESMEHDKIKDMGYVDLLKEIILYLKIELSHKNEQLTTLIKSSNVNVEVGSKHVELDIETMLENTHHQLNET